MSIPGEQRNSSYIKYGYKKVELMHECFQKHLRMGTT